MVSPVCEVSTPAVTASVAACALDDRRLGTIWQKSGSTGTMGRSRAGFGLAASRNRLLGFPEATHRLWQGYVGRRRVARLGHLDHPAWTTLSDDLRDRHWWVNCKLRGNLPAEVLSTDELLLLVRLLTEYAEPRTGYTIAQFRRVMPAEGRTVIAIEADCVSPDEQP
jgi:hypothetical protein